MKNLDQKNEPGISNADFRLSVMALALINAVLLFCYVLFNKFIGLDLFNIAIDATIFFIFLPLTDRNQVYKTGRILAVSGLILNYAYLLIRFFS